ncbi:M23 family metallopeptidase [Natronosporangium hydrolyticum]|uniref:M23 family metallopeptidase n=1 Tax=Natronosporangium hydrolyticum TaxID=2811111 RepID=A0A895YDJ1_9ACTN|nr:M23 family metallopeptidase [Natronosporangium hydrolyticum]QSB15621.1 M23 family metallopeptidase [Natronosporangium hydrolyticum]
MSAIALVLPGLFGAAAPASQQPADDEPFVYSPDPVLVDEVMAQLPPRDDTVATDVHVQRENADKWAFGTVVQVAPEEPERHPDGWLWLAWAEGDRWRVALEGSPQFARVSDDAPVLTEPEQEVLGTTGYGGSAPLATDFRTGMRLPYAVGQQWRYTGGPHPMSGTVRSSIDLAGGDGRVLAAADGYAYTMCPSETGWIRVVHGRGFATDYYHLEDNIVVYGSAVAEGDYIGMIGNDVSCGGSSTGPHVHFSLRRDGEYVPIDGYNLGKWVIGAGAANYQGFARHGSTRVDVGGVLHNHGALALDEGVVDTFGPGELNRRGGPGAEHEIVGSVADGATVTIECSARGSDHTGRDRTTNVWHRLGDGGWVSAAYVWTGAPDPLTRWC